MYKIQFDLEFFCNSSKPRNIILSSWKMDKVRFHEWVDDSNPYHRTKNCVIWINAKCDLDFTYNCSQCDTLIDYTEPFHRPCVSHFTEKMYCKTCTRSSKHDLTVLDNVEFYCDFVRPKLQKILALYRIRLSHWVQPRVCGIKILFSDFSETLQSQLKEQSPFFRGEHQHDDSESDENITCNIQPMNVRIQNSQRRFATNPSGSREQYLDVFDSLDLDESSSSEVYDSDSSSFSDDNSFSVLFGE